MKKYLIIAWVLCAPTLAFALRIINDSPTEIAFYTYNRGDGAYTFAWQDKKFIVAAGASVNFTPHDNGGCKIQLWRSSNGQFSQRLIAPGRIFVNSDLIIITAEGTVDTNQEGVTPLDPTVNSTPEALTYGDRILEGQGFIEQGSITSSKGYKLILEGGKLKVKNPSGAACLTFKEEGVKYVKLVSGTLFLYTDGANGGYAVIGTYGTLRPGATVDMPWECGIRTVKNSHTEWSISNKMMPAKP